MLPTSDGLRTAYRRWKILSRPKKRFGNILLERSPKINSALIILAVLILSSPAVAQSWEEYSYPDYAFSVDFPAKPLVENKTHQVAVNRSVPARVYSVRQNSSELKVTIADLANTGLDETSVIDYAIKTQSAGGEVTSTSRSVLTVSMAAQSASGAGMVAAP